MKLLLIDQNPIIQKLISLSAQKANVDVEIIKSLDTQAAQKSYDFVFIDDEVFEPNQFEELKKSINSSVFVFIHGKNRLKEDGFDAYIQKPFLPTEIVDFLTNYKQKDLSIFEDKKESAFSDKSSFSDTLDGSSFIETIDIQEDSSLKLDDDLDGLIDKELSLEDSLEQKDDLEELEKDINLDMDTDPSSELSLISTQESANELNSELDINLDLQENQEDEKLLDLEGQELGSGGILDKNDIDEVKNLLQESENIKSQEIESIDSLELDEVSNLDIKEEAINDLTQDNKELELNHSLDELNLSETTISEKEDGMQKMKIENSELASLTEEALSEALGESVIEDIGDLKEFESIDSEETELEIQEELDSSISSELDNTILEDESSQKEEQAKTPVLETPQTSQTVPLFSTKDSNTISTIANTIAQMDVDKLKKLLDGLQITIQLSYPNKQ